MTQDQINQLMKRYNLYQGYDTYSKLAMLSPSEGEQVMKDTSSQINKESTDTGQKALDSLNGLLPNDSPYYQQFMQRVGNINSATQQMVEPQQQTYDQGNQFYNQLIQKGPMFELAMRPEIAKVSPTFMGANTRALEAKLDTMGITDPLEKDALISNYMKYADKAMTMTLSSLGQMRDALVIAAGQANESNKAELNKAISTTDELKKYLFAINNDWLESKINPKSEDQKWSEPYQLGDATVQKNTITGEIRTVSGAGAETVGGVSPFFETKITNGINANLTPDKVIEDLEAVYEFSDKERDSLFKRAQELYDAKNKPAETIVPTQTSTGIRPSGSREHSAGPIGAVASWTDRLVDFLFQ